MKKINNQQIILGLQSSSEQEVDYMLKYLYDQCRPTISKYILRSKGSEQDVDDVFHEGIIAFYKLAREDKIDRDTNVEAYLYTICRNMWSKSLKKKFQTTDLSNGPEPAIEEDFDEFDAIDQSALLKEVISKLGEGCQKVLKLYYFDKFRMQKIAQEMGFQNEQVARNKKAKCLASLRKIVLQSPFYKKNLSKKV